MIIEEMTMTEFVEGLSRCRTVLIPFGSVEEHGSHLPLSTDTLQACRVGEDAAQVLPLFVAPPVHYGNCRSTSCHPGTISISTATLQALTKDIVRSLYSQGMVNFIFLTGHAGGSQKMALQDVGEQLLAELPTVRIAILVDYDLAWSAGTGIVETEGDSHAGEIETSRILFSHPQLVKGTAAREFPAFPPHILVRNKRKFWPGGVWGDPASGSAEKGRLLHERIVTRIVELVQTLENWTE